MRTFILLLLLLFCSCLSSYGQRITKDPNEIGACINVTKKLAAINTGRIANGMVTIWTLDEVVLLAKVEVRGGKRTRVGWAVVDKAGNPVVFDTTTRTRPRQDKLFQQSLVYTRGTNPEGCFVVEEKQQ